MAGERVREIAGTALPLRGDDIDTDRIIPARFLKSVRFEGLETHLFEDDRQQTGAAGVIHPVSNAAYAGATILLVQSNFGCGSSREHAPQAIQRRGIRAIVGRSFSEIFFGNALALGMPCVSAGADAIETLLDLVEAEARTRLVLDLASMRVTAGSRALAIAMPAAARESLLDGSWDATGLLVDDFAAVRAVAARLPYVADNW